MSKKNKDKNKENIQNNNSLNVDEISEKDNKRQNEKKLSDKNKSVSKKKKKKKNGLINDEPKPIKKIKPPPPSDVNPLIRILDQHREHKLRIAKISASIFLVVVVLIMFFLYLAQYTKNKKHENKISEKEKKLEIINQRIANSEGYEQDKAIIKAIEQTFRIQKEDFEHQDKWEKIRKDYLNSLKHKFIKPEKGKSFVCKSIAAEMICIPQGHFKMGRALKEHGNTSELPRHDVQITYSFWMAKTEITNAQYRIYYDRYKVSDWDGYSFNGITQPVVKISWHLANEYCEMLTFHEKKAKRLPENYVYRLPTEAEWEYACRAGVETIYYWGNDFGAIGGQYANVLDKFSAKHLDCKTDKNAPIKDGNYVTAPVASYKPNAFGLYDMSGNAWEWCWDWYNPKAYSNLFGNDPVQVKPVVSSLMERGDFEREFEVKTTTKVIRGGGCLSPPSDARSATRDHLQPEKRDLGIGFRIVLAPAIKFIHSDDSDEN